MDEEFIMVLTTIDSEEKAKKISENIVEQDLAACVQVYGPIKSTYKWEGEMTSSEEWMCFIKTKKDVYDVLEDKIRQIHDYENPEIVALPITDGSGKYLDWLDENIQN